MIINFPTAFYIPRLKNADNIIFTISSEDPPQALVLEQQLPAAEEIRPLPEREFRFSPGVGADLVSSFSKNAPSDPGSNRKQFEVGGLISFEDSEDIPEISDEEVPQNVDLLQDQNLLDLRDFELTDEEIVDLEAQAETKFQQTVDDLNGLKNQIETNKTTIVELQKKINEVRKIFDSTVSVIGEGDISERLQKQEDDLVKERDDLIASTNVIITEANALFGELLKIREIVR